MRVTIAASGGADPAEVWERYAEPSRWSGWSPQVRVVSTRDRIRPGLAGRVNAVLPFTVLAVDEDARTWSWVAGAGPLRLHLDHAVLVDGAGSRTTLTVVGAPWLVLPYLPLARFALGRLVS